jgi:hypothetical protein
MLMFSCSHWGMFQWHLPPEGSPLPPPVFRLHAYEFIQETGNR